MAERNFWLENVSAASFPGSRERANEDRMHAAPHAGLVIDGATGLAEKRLIPWGGSDAAWLAQRAKGLIAAELQKGPSDLRAVIRTVNAALRADLAEALRKRRDDGPRQVEHTPTYALPTAAFQLVRLRRMAAGAPAADPPIGLETAGLGDCSLFLLQSDGRFWRSSGSEKQREAERLRARDALEQSGGLGGEFLRRPDVLDALRQARAKHNQPGGGVWTLGVAPEASRHLRIETFESRPGALLLLATDGFADLVDLYGAYDGAGLVRAVADHGVNALMRELREIEQALDPKGERYPRFKQSDDATALLMRLCADNGG